VGFYSRAKRGLTDAGEDLLDLASAFEKSYQDRNLDPLKKGVADYIGTEHAPLVMLAAPAAAGYLAADTDETTAGASVLAGAAAAPFAGNIFYSKEMKEALEEEETIKRKIDEIDGRLKSRPTDDLVEAGSVSKYADTISGEELQDLVKQKASLEGNSLPAARRRQTPIRHKQRALGGGAVAAAATIAALLTRQKMEEQQPTLSQKVNGYSPTNAPTYSPQGDILNLNADFSGAQTSVVPPVRSDLLEYWGVG